MPTVDSPDAITEIRHMIVPMPDGCELAARVWMPRDANDHPVPAILDYIPYRQNDLTAARDAEIYPLLAANGYVVIRLDLRGSGDSDGVLRGEYLPQEQQDGFDAIAWIAEQPWCDGGVGMVGISWGGFNGLQIAAMQPPALKAIISLCSTDDRYATDVHYMGGCMTGEQLSWSTYMLSRNALPPDPKNVGDKWRDMWLDRLNAVEPWLKTWLDHQGRDDYWRQGSICEDWSKIQIPVYLVSGWADGYTDALFRMMAHLQGPKKGLVGPWAHDFPHQALPGPAIDFVDEELRWFDHWLKGRDTGIMQEPPLRLFLQDSVAPRSKYGDRPGTWIAEPSWPSPHISSTAYHLHCDGMLSPQDPVTADTLSHSSPSDVGKAAGRWCGFCEPGDLPRDQRGDDGGSLCFDTAPLPAPLTIVGSANLHLRVSVDRPVAQVTARLCDVDPDGRSTRVSLGILNLTHRNSHETPEALEPGKIYDITIPLKHVAQRFAAGHRVRLALSTSYFPMVWPSPEAVRMTLHTKGSVLNLPLRKARAQDDNLRPFGPARTSPRPEQDMLEPPERYFQVVDTASDTTTEVRLAEGGGRYRLHANDLTVYDQVYETFTVDQHDITTAKARVESQLGMSRDDWQVRSHVETELSTDQDAFVIRARMRVWEGDNPIKDTRWDYRIPRNHA